MNKQIFYVVFILKYIYLLNVMPEMEIERYIYFFRQCENLAGCINPYGNIELLPSSYLSFPFSNFMYILLLPAFLITSFFNISFVNLTYLIFEIALIYGLKQTFTFTNQQLIPILLLNPVMIYSIGFLGQLDFIPLTFFIYSLFFLKNKKKYISLTFLIIASSTKIIFILLLPLSLLYFLKAEKSLINNFQTIFFSLSLFIFLNIQLFIDQTYRSAVFFGLEEGYGVVQGTQEFFTNSLFLIVFFTTTTFFIYWKYINRLDFYGVTIFAGFLTIPLFLSNLSNIGWFLWSMPVIILLFISFEKRVKVMLYLSLLLLVVSDSKLLLDKNIFGIETLITYLIFPIFFIVIYYAVQALSQNTYFKIKAKPIIFSIAGDSATGKTTLANTIQSYFGNNIVDIIEMDSFHKHERDSKVWNEYTHLNPQMNNLVEFRRVLLNLIKGKTQFVKKYNHLNGKFDDVNRKILEDFLIIEGLHALLFTDLNALFDLKVFIDTESSLKEQLKINRDLKRNKELLEIKKEISNRKKDYIKFINPQIENSDLYIKTISSDDNSVVFELMFSEDYFYEFEEMMQKICKLKILKKVNNNRISLKVIIDKKDSIDIFNLLSSGLLNLRNEQFDLEQIIYISNREVLLKLAIVLFTLNQRIESKIR